METRRRSSRIRSPAPLKVLLACAAWWSPNPSPVAARCESPLARRDGRRLVSSPPSPKARLHAPTRRRRVLGRIRGGRAEPHATGTTWPNSPPHLKQPWSSKAGAHGGHPTRDFAPRYNGDPTAASLYEARPLDDLLDRSSRTVFVRRVYGLLGASLGLSALACVLCAAHPRAVLALLLHPLGRAILTAAAGVGFGAPLALGFSPGLRRDPSRAVPLFAAFAVAEALLLGVACTRFSLSTVMLAVAQTAIATLGLFAYGHQPNPRYDLTAFGSGLFATFLVLLLSAGLGAAFAIPGVHLLYSTLGAILFSLYIVYDVQLIVGGQKKQAQLDTRDYVLGATMLYLDIANLFFMLLRIADGADAGGAGDD